MILSKIAEVLSAIFAFTPFRTFQSIMAAVFV